MRRSQKAEKGRVIVAMSGGVDSSVAAALLKRAGFEVVGVFMKLVNIPRFREGEKRARKVAEILKISFLVLDLRKEFKKRIIGCFLNEYKNGLTPNPCVICNKEIKFELLEKKFPRNFIATGHYARLEKGRLFKGRDREKDQSYFLWQLSQKQLKHAFFPVGQYAKKEVRLLAQEFNLPVLDSPESQEICFIQTTINDFLSRQIKQKPGKILDPEGKILGRHQGLAFYTIGQRRGIKLAGGPYFVLDKNLKKNSLIVTKNEKDLSKKELIAKKVNWISGKNPKLPLKVKAKIRYRHQGASVTITKILHSTFYILKFAHSQRAITPGQSVVFYQGQELLGGGIIC